MDAGANHDPGLSALAREFQAFVADVEELIKSTSSLGGDDWIRAKAGLQARVEAAREFINEIGGSLSDRARNVIRDTDSYVHEQPWQAIGIAAAASLVVGYLVGRRG